jgi:hypothetical protein
MDLNGVLFNFGKNNVQLFIRDEIGSEIKLTYGSQKFGIDGTESDTVIRNRVLTRFLFFSLVLINPEQTSDSPIFVGGDLLTDKINPLSFGEFAHFTILSKVVGDKEFDHIGKSGIKIIDSFFLAPEFAVFFHVLVRDASTVVGDFIELDSDGENFVFVKKDRKLLKIATVKFRSPIQFKFFGQSFDFFVVEKAFLFGLEIVVDVFENFKIGFGFHF